MSWQAIAKKDFQDSVRSRVLWGIIVLFALLIGGIAYLVVDSGLTGANQTVAEALVTGVFGLLVLFFIPITGLFISIKSVVRERESGTINLLLSLPHTRGDMILGKFLGRAAVMTVTIIVGFVPAIAMLLLQTELSPGVLLSFWFVTVLFGLMFVSIGVGFSALFNSETQGTVGGIVIFFGLYLWQTVTDLVLGLVDYELPNFANRFGLGQMFQDMFGSLSPSGRGFGAPSSVLGETVRRQNEAGEVVFQTVYPESVAFYMQNWFVFVILLLWIAVPLAVGYARFSQIDL
ncbi:ABC transporter permease subunit [Halovenus sp. WSH3]|uniref:ABC transporter permease subunit n=1 Tax=Halovenus carboxidivorans TaxID=2692199 RepID=A0A6B0T899_9EURY|nr:ABC transporter permease subunit [Halovenus carboxidivorans]MXR53167.1 ABC transporter permease subunit [Halovenus carboxidivorans]